MAQRLIRNWALPVSQFNATLKCRDCEIFIGAGHEDAEPVAAPDGQGVLCRSCLAAWRRRHRASAYEPVEWSLS